MIEILLQVLCNDLQLIKNFTNDEYKKCTPQFEILFVSFKDIIFLVLLICKYTIWGEGNIILNKNLTFEII
jgi:hypothetical protein